MQTTGSVSGILWPRISGLDRAAQCDLLDQLETTQWLPTKELRKLQLRQLTEVVRHAYYTTPFYRARLDAIGWSPRKELTAADVAKMPLLTRRDLQIGGTALHSKALPADHGPATLAGTSGSTGQPVEVLRSGIVGLMWSALTVRDHFWHERDFSQRLAAIRFSRSPKAIPPFGAEAADWGPATRPIVETGKACLLTIETSVAEQAAWIRRIGPAYLIGYPSCLRALTQYSAQSGIRFPTLREVRTFGEILEPECRTECEQFFGVPVVDMYSSQEVGYITLQCPLHKHHHVQAESLYVEVLDEKGRACRPGAVGRVVISTLHNFAMPLLRYDIGDYAEVGKPCPCGRGLPVLNRILGRQRNMLVLPNGDRRWPVFGHGKSATELPPFFQFQVHQKSVEHIDVKVVRARPLTAAEHETLTTYLRQALAYPFRVTLTYVDAIPRSPTGKFEDFVSDVV